MTRRPSRPRPAFLLRICETPVETVLRHYELHDLRDGTVYRFVSLTALTRFLRAQHAGAHTAAAPAGWKRK